MAYNAVIDDDEFSTVLGGVSPLTAHAPIAFLRSDVENDEGNKERVTLWAKDGRRLAAALRRAAAEIELATIKGR